MVVGPGMLDAACPGDVFAAPPSDYVYQTAKLVASDKGVLLLVNNYTGDRMAFEMASELAEADGLKVATLFINDDVAVQDSTWTVGRRGVAGNFFVIKAVRREGRAGRVAGRGQGDRREGELGDPDDGHRAHRLHAAGKGQPAVRAGRGRDGGRRGHPRRARTPSRQAGQRQRDRGRTARRRRPRPALRVGRPGCADDQRPRWHPDQRALPALRHRRGEARPIMGITVAKSYVGEYCTSLEMAGASLTLVKLDDEIEALLDAPASIVNRTF